MSAIDPFPAPLRGYLGEFVVRRRRLRIFRAIGVALAFCIAWMTGWALVDRLVSLAAWLRLALSIGNVVGIAFILRRPVLEALSTRVDWIGATAEIESREPRFSQRLQTVVSQLLAPSQVRGAAGLIRQLVDEVSQIAAQRHSAALLPTQVAMAPWTWAATALLVMAVLMPVRWLDLPTLLLRQFRPLAAVPPVTTVRLDVSPGNARLVEGQALRVSVRADGLDGDDDVMLRHSADGSVWSSHRLTRAGGGTFVHVFPSLGHDLRYQVCAGDASSGTYSVRVVRRPAVLQFRVRYDYPTYIRREPLTVTNTDGLIEAPVGTEATITLTATGPLDDARLRVGDRAVGTIPTVEANVRQAKLTITRDLPWRVHLRSREGIDGSGPPGSTIRALPDRPPLLRLLAPTGELRLAPRDLMLLPYQALDDYGLETLSASVGVNGASPRSVPLALPAERRFREDVLRLDLAELGVAVGDLVAVSLVATDGAGQVGTSPTVRVLISPRSIDLNATRRLGELKDAAQYVDLALSELRSARSRLGEKPAPGDVLRARDARVGPHTQSAAEALRLAVRSVTRAILRSPSAQMSVSMAGVVDALQAQAEYLERTDERMPELSDDALADRLARSASAAEGALRPLQTLWHGEQAAALLAERDNLRAARSQRAAATGESLLQGLAELLRASISRARNDIQSGAGELGLDPTARGFEQQLVQRVRAMEEQVRAAVPVDFADIARRWAGGAANEAALPGRLTAAAHAEAVRPDSDLVRARDLQLAARAARRIDEPQFDGRPPATQPGTRRDGLPRERYPDVIATLQREHELNRRPDVNPEQLTAAREAAGEARAVLRRWAGEPADGVARSEDVGDEQLALEAGAESARRRYGSAEALDRHLTSRADTAPSRGGAAPAEGASADPDAAARRSARVSRKIREARQTDSLLQEQERLRDETESAARETRTGPDLEAGAGQLAGEQEALGSAIEQARREQAQEQWDPAAPASNSREAAMAAIRSAQEELAAMPQQLAETQQAAEDRRQAEERVRQAEQSAAAAPDAQQPALRRMGEEALRQAAQARSALGQASRPLSPDAPQLLAGQLDRYVPETQTATQALRERLAPALAALRQSLEASDPAGADRASRQARQAIAEAQQALADAQQRLLERDPLVAARWFSGQAVAALRKRPPDFRSAAQYQKSTSAALARAWDDAIHEAAAARLGGLPSMLPLLRLEALEEGGANGPAGAEGAIPSAREWGDPRQQSPQQLASPLRESDPPGYQDALRVYFEALAQPRNQMTGGKK